MSHLPRNEGQSRLAFYYSPHVSLTCAPAEPFSSTEDFIFSVASSGSHFDDDDWYYFVLVSAATVNDDYYARNTTTELP